MARTYRLGPARRAVNSAVTALIKAGLGGRSNYLLTTVGRRTGQSRTTPVTLIEDEAGRWLVSPYGNVGWVYNVRSHPQVTLRRGQQTEVLRVEEAAPDTAGPVLQHYVRRVRITAPFFDAKPGDPVATFVQEAGRHPVFRLSSTRIAA